MLSPRFFIDIGPLRRFPQFRRLWLGYVVSIVGSQLTTVAVAYQVFLITRSSLDVGFVSLAQLGPALIAPIFGGSIADAVDRRKLLLVTNVLAALCSLGLALNAQGRHPALWPLFVLSAAGMGCSSIDAPTRLAVMMTLVDRKSFVAANVLRQLLTQLALVVGPTLSGLLIAGFGVKVVYWVDVASFSTSIVAILSLQPLQSEGGATKFGFESMKEGFKFIRGHRLIQACLLADFDATVLGVPVSLFPAIGLTQFHGGPRAVGYLYAAPGVGAILGVLLSGWTNRVRRTGRAVIIAVAAWGLAFVGFGLSPWLPLALVFLVMAGASNLVSAIFRNTIIQLVTPDRIRGRVASIQSAVFSAGPRLGNTEAGVVASLAGTQFSVISGGVACVLGIALIAKCMPGLSRYEMPHGASPAPLESDRLEEDVDPPP